MSAPGSRNPQADFLATRGKAAAGPSGIDFLNQIAGGGGDGAQTVQPAPTQAAPAAAGGSGSTAAPPPASPSLPFGLKVENGLKAAASSAAATVTGDMSASWDTLKKDFVTATGMSLDQQKAFHGGSFWDQMKSQWDRSMATGALPLDAFKTAISPLTGTADAATGAVAKAAFKVLPEVPGFGEKELHQGLNTALSLIGPEAGGAGAAAKLGEGAEAAGATDLAAGANAKPGVQPAAGASAKAEAVGEPPLAGKASSDAAGVSGEGLETAAAQARPFEMSVSELDTAIEDQSMSDHQKLVKALGEDGAEEFKRLDQARNNTIDTARADRAANEFDEKFGSLTSDQERLVYGIGEENLPTVDDLKAIRSAREYTDGLSDASDEEVGRVLSRGMLDVSPDEVDRLIKGDDLPAGKTAAAIQIQGALKELATRYGSLDKASSIILPAMKARGYSEADAAEVLLTWRQFQRRGAREAIGLPSPGAKPAAADVPPRAFDIAGEEPGADLKVTPELRQKAADFLQGKGTSPIDVHLDALADPATRADAVGQIAKIIPKGSVKPLDVSEMGAYSLNLTPDELMTQIRPAFPSDETFMAAAMAQNSAAEVFWNAAQKARDTSAPEDVEAATRAYTLFNNYTGAFRDAKTDWGRGGRAQQVAMQARGDFTKHIQSVADYAGQDNIEEIIRKTADLDDPRKVSPFVASMRWMGGRDGFMYGWYNWLLSHAVIPKKLVSDASLATLNIGTRYWAEKLGSGAVAPGETAALVQGYLGSMKDAIRAAGKAFKSGQSQFAGDYQSLFNGHFFDRGGKLADGTPGPFAPGTTTGAALEYLRMAMPTSAIAAADDFAKVSNYRAELHAMAFRNATSAAAGDPAAFAGHYDSLINNVQPAMHEQAVSAALRNTLQEPLDGVGASLQQTLDQFNIPVGRSGVEIPLGRILVPFTKIATNSMRMAYRSSPLPYLAPSDAWRAAMASGGAKRDLAQAQAGLGTAVSMLGVMLAVGGKLTGSGPSSPDERAAWLRTGNKPYHLQLGGVQTPYNHIEPLATSLGVIADTTDLMRYAHEDDNAQLAVSLGLGIGHAMLDKTYMSTISQLLEAMDAPDQKGQRFAQSFLSGLAVPGEMSMVQRAIDPWLRSHNDLMSSIKARTPGFSKDLPPARNLWGDPVSRENDWVPAISQGAKSAAFGPDDTAEPIDQWIWKNRANFPDGDQGRLGLSTPPRTLSFDVGAGDPVHIPLSLQQIDKLRVLAGNGAKDPSTGLGAKDALNALVTGKSPNEALQSQFNSATPQRQALMVLNQWSKYRAGAKAQLLRGDQSLQDQIKQAKDGRRALVAPTIGGTP